MNRDPESNINKMPIEPGMKVAEFGSGTGVYAFLLSKKVGSAGKVYAIEVQKELLARSEAEARSQNLGNIEYILADVETPGGSKLADSSLDAVLMANTLFILESKYSAVVEMKRVLKPGGKAIVIDWSQSFGGIGPHPNQVVTEEEAKDIFNQAGFTYLSSFSSGDHHYGAIFEKPLQSGGQTNLNQPV